MDELQCEPYVIEGDPADFFTSEWGTCVPLGTTAAYKDKDLITLQLVVDYLQRHPPYLTLAYYPEELVERTSNVERLPVHEEEWRRHIFDLMGPEGTCYVSEWILEPATVESELEGDFSDYIVSRGQPDVPVLVQWAEEVVGDPSSESVPAPFSALWSFGTWGYILPAAKRSKILEWTKKTRVSESEVEEFFETLTCMFRVWDELDCIMILSHRLNTEDVRTILAKNR